MISQVSSPRLKNFRFPGSIISYAVWAYHRFALSLRDVEDLSVERGVIVSYESIRVWCQWLGTQLAAKIRRDRPAPPCKWHLDEVVIMIRRQKYWLWRVSSIRSASVCQGRISDFRSSFISSSLKKS
jgi:putative transposase